MKDIIRKLLITIIFSASILSLSSPADANYQHRGEGYRNGYYNHGGYRHHGYRRHCRWINGYWARGYWHPARRVCFVR